MRLLISHPNGSSGAVHGIHADVSRAGDGLLVVRYRLKGDLERLHIPPPETPRTRDRLWQHTCFEVFIARQGLSPYHELNFSPSGAWAMYAFEAYRTPQSSQTGVGRSNGIPEDMPAHVPVDPRIRVLRSERELELEALIRLDRLSPMYARAALTLALSAVIEDEEGALSYWALAHPSDKPDFHHPLAFAMDLDEIRD